MALRPSFLAPYAYRSPAYSVKSSCLLFQAFQILTAKNHLHGVNILKKCLTKNL